MMPNMQTAIFGFEETLAFQIVDKTIVDGDVAETSKVKVPLYFEGSIMPLNPRELLVKPEGERKWKWWTMYTDMDLNVDWVIKDPNGTLFRVMSSGDWREAGFRQYQLKEGPGL